MTKPSSSVPDDKHGTNILAAEYGSRALGTDLESSDRDIMGLVVEHPKYITGLDAWDGARHGGGSGPGGRASATDVEVVTYSLRKWARLAAAGNPTVTQLLFSDEFEIMTPEGAEILSITDAFISRRAGARFLGYMTSQRAGVLGERSTHTSRPELVEAHGYDTKFAAHWLRLGMQGIELMSTGHMTLPLEDADRGVLKAVRRGEITLKEVTEIGTLLENNLTLAIANSELPENPDEARINAVLHSVYQSVWAESSRSVPE